MNEIEIYQNEEFGSVRCVMINDEPYFVGKDVAEALGYERATKAIRDHVDDTDVDEIPIQDSIGRMQNTPVINESGLYSLILSSKLSSAKRFQRWVKSEVLPSIRKTGTYSLSKIDSAWLAIGKAETKADLALAVRNYVDLEKQPLLEKIEKDKPMVEFAEHVTQTADTLDIGELSKIIKNDVIENMGRNKLFAYLRNKKILMNNNVPYQKYINNEWFEVIETTKLTPYGTRVFPKTLVTGKGQVNIVEMIRKDFSDKAKY